MQYITAQSSSALEDIDNTLAQDSRDLKTVIVNHKDIVDDFRNLVVAHLAASNQAYVMDKCSSGSFKNILRNVFALCTGLNYNKELRDIFSSLLEKVVEPCQALGWSASEVDLFFQALVTCFESIQSLNANYRKKYGGSFARIMNATRLSCMRMLKTTS
jgi:hypothetical protein